MALYVKERKCMKLDAAVVRLLEDHSLLKSHIAGVLDTHAQRHSGNIDLTPNARETSAVLFLLGKMVIAVRFRAMGRV